MDRKRLQMLLEVAILGALSFVLDQITLFKMPQGGSITLSMLPVIVMAFRWGLAGGMLTGLLTGTLQAVIGGTLIHPVQGFLDYFGSYTVVGLAAVTLGWYRKAMATGNKGGMAAAVIAGTVIGGLLRYLCHYIAGIVFYAQYAGDQPAWLYSLIYNGSFMIPSIILCSVIAVPLFASSQRLLKHA